MLWAMDQGSKQQTNNFRVVPHSNTTILAPGALFAGPVIHPTPGQ